MGYFKDWWKSLFGVSGETDELGFPVLKRGDIPPMPKVKPCKPEKDISEPVISFVALYKKNHRRFKISMGGGAVEGVVSWSLEDKKENKIFHALSCSPYHGDYYNSSKNTKWITQDELGFVFDEIREFLNSRKDAVERKKNDRARKRLTKLYKGE